MNNIPNKINPLPNMLLTIGLLPSSYLVSMTYEEQLLWLCNFLKTEVIPKTNANIEAVNQLITYIDNYFDNLDVQEEIDNKLNEMIEDGTFDRIINDELLTEINNKYDSLDEKVDENYSNLSERITLQTNDLNTAISNQNNNLNNSINSQNLIIQNNNLTQNEKIDDLEDRIDQIASGAPIVVTSTSQMTDHTKIYVLTTDGNWYYYNGTSFVSGGVYQATEDSDSINKINKILNELSMNYSYNKFEERTNPPSNILPYNSSVTTSSDFANIITGWSQLNTGTITTNSSKYYLLYCEVERQLTDTATQGIIRIDPYLWSSQNSNPSYSWQGIRNNVSMTVEKGKKEICTFGFKTNDNVDIFPKILFQNTGTSSKTVNYNITKVGIIEYNSLDEINQTGNNYHFLSQLGMIIPNDKYGNNKTKELEEEINSIEVPTYDCDIIFWGDSLTAGDTNFPSIVSQRLNKTILNMGVGGENGYTILARQGSITPVIPANANCSSFYLKDINNNNIDPLIQGNAGVNPIKIDDDNNEYTLSRNNDGTYKIVDSNNNVINTTNYIRFIKFNGSNLNGTISVLFIGTNGPSTDALKNILHNAIRKNTNNKFIIMGLTAGNTSSRTSYVNTMVNEFGNKFFNTGELLSRYGMNIIGLTPTSADETAINQGQVPPSLLADNIHLNNYGINALGILLSNFIANLY